MRHQRYRGNASLAVLSVLGFIACVISICIYGFSSWMAGVNFERSCEGFLKQAADSTSFKIANERLERALSHLDDNNLTSGRSHVFIYKPSCDVGFWYENLKAALEESKKAEESLATAKDPAARTTAETNALMKLRETLLDDTSAGVVVTLPPNMYVYPDQVYWTFWWLGSIIMGCIFFIVAWVCIIV